MNKNKIQFSKWIRWEERNQLQNIKEPGVYILAKFEEVPNAKPDLKSKRILYFGETCASLRQRWNQFKYSAFQGKRAHSGGSSYREEYKKEKDNHQVIYDDGSDLYVSAFPITSPKEKGREVLIRYIERKLIYEYWCKNGELPKLNKK